MAKKDYKAICGAIIEACGGEGNISGVSHCMTRLRLQLRDSSKLNEEKAKHISGLLGMVVQNGEYQFVVGQDVATLYEEFEKRDGIKTTGVVEDAEALKEDMGRQKGNVLNMIMSFIGDVYKRQSRCR